MYVSNSVPIIFHITHHYNYDINHEIDLVEKNLLHLLSSPRIENDEAG